MFRRHSVSVLLLLSLLPCVAGAQGEAKPPDSEESGEPEGSDRGQPPRPIDPRFWGLKDPLLLGAARQVEAGTAPLPMARGFDRLYTRLFPFTQGVPAGWRERALRAEHALRNPRRYGTGSLAQIPQSLNWALIGPASYALGADNVSGRATALWVDPADKNIIILGAGDGGLWKTVDQGVTWASLSGNLPTLSIGCIAVDPANSNVIYVGTGEGNNNPDLVGGMGIFKSSNGGASWAALPMPGWSYNQPYQNVSRIVVDPRNSNKIYAAVDGGFYFSSTAGAAWTKTILGAAGTIIGCDLAVDEVTPVAGAPSIVYVAFGYYWGVNAANGIYRNTDGNLGNNASWVKISAAPATGFPVANIGRINLAMAPSDRKQLYALISNSDTSNNNMNLGKNLGIFHTVDATAATVVWMAGSIQQYCGFQCYYNMPGAVDPATPAKLFVGGTNVQLSTDSGVTLVGKSLSVGGSATGPNFVHADQHFMVMPDASTLYVVSDGGFFIGTVSGTTVSWVNRNAGLATLQFYGFAQDPADPGKLHGGLQDNGEFYYNGSSWTEVQFGDGFRAAWDPVNPLYSYEEYAFGSLRRNSNMVGTPLTWSCIRNFGAVPNNCSTCNSCNPDLSTAFNAPFTLDSNDANTLYAASKFIYRNSDARGSSIWVVDSVDLSLAGNSITVIHSAKNGGVPGAVYAGTANGKVQLSTNANTATPPAAWLDRSAGLSGAWVTAITTDPANYLKVVVTLSGYASGTHVYRSTTGGASWTNITGALPAAPFNTLVLSPTDANHAYAGSDAGVFENIAVWTTNTWTSIQANLPPVGVDELGFNPVNGNLRAATHGRSIWELLTVTAVARPVPDGLFIPGVPLTASKGAGADITVAFDTASCTPGGYNAYWGTLDAAALPAYAYSGTQCAITSGGAITSIPAGTSAFFVVAGTDGAKAESRNVQDSSGVWHGNGAGLCGITVQNSASTCP